MAPHWALRARRIILIFVKRKSIDMFDPKPLRIWSHGKESLMANLIIETFGSSFAFNRKSQHSASGQRSLLEVTLSTVFDV